MPPASGETAAPSTPLRDPKRRNADLLRRHLRDVGESLGPRDLEVLCARLPQVIAVDVTVPALGVPVVKVIVPGRAADVDMLG